MRLNPADRESGLALLGFSNGRERAKRKPTTKSQWVGVRADGGVVNSGRWAFCVWNETGGNLRVGWSCTEASLKLGTDAWSFGYGGTATKSTANSFTKFGQTFGQGDAITCCVDLDRRAILYMKNGREIPGDAFSLGKELAGWPLFPHIYTKEATFAVSFDGKGGAPPLTGGFQWIVSAGASFVYSPLQAPQGAGLEDVEEDSEAHKSNFVLTSFGWRTTQESGVSQASQEWRDALDAYVKHFTLLLEREYEAEREAVIERVQNKSPSQIQADGVGLVGLSAEFEHESGRISLWTSSGQIPYLAEINRGRTVLLSTVTGGVDVDDAAKTISGEVENIQIGELVIHTQYERLPGSNMKMGTRNQVQYRIDLGPNIIAYKRIDRMLDELQRCLGTAQAKRARSSIEKLNTNQNLTGLLLPGTPLASALYADISESCTAASKWDPLSRPASNPEADISKAARERDIGAAPYQPRGPVPQPNLGPRLNASQQEASRLVLERRRRFSLIQGPPGTGKTTTAVAMICGWLRSRRGPILATAFSNRGTDNLAEGLHALGVRVLRMGLCERDKPFSLDARLQECGARRGDKGMQAVLKTVDVVAATCIGCGMGPLDKLAFPFVVVDEAAQVIEPAVLLPLGKGAVQAVMVGDQCQLPATVLSQEAQKRGLDISMFDRLLSMGMEVQMLKEQYRMHPQIAAFPSWRFYRGDLRTGVPESARQRPPGLPLKGPAAFIHVEAVEQRRGPSKRNGAEAACVAWLVDRVLQALPARLTGEEIGIITPYAAQVSEIRSCLSQSAKQSVQTSSVDAFQGCEKDVIIISLVRANQGGDVGFVADWRRLNVALTRAKCLCVMIGHLPTWLGTESGLLRDWVGFHSASAADVLAYSGGKLHPLQGEFAYQVHGLRKEFEQNRPKAAALPRISVAAKDSSSTRKLKLRMLEAARALADAIGGEDMTVLEAALSEARQVGVQTGTVEEGEDALRRLTLMRVLEDAAAGGDESLLQQAISDAKETGIKSVKIKQAEDLWRRRVASQELDAAVAAADEAKLQRAVAKARGAGLEPGVVQAGEAALRCLVASRRLVAAVGEEREGPLELALAEARLAGVQIRGIEEAEAVLRRLVAARELEVAIGGTEAEVLQTAIINAQESGVLDSAIDEGLLVLRQWDAARSLKDLLDGDGSADNYDQALSTALDAARGVGVAAASIEAAQARLRTRASARALEAAMEATDEHALREAVTSARGAGVDNVLTDAAMKRLQLLVALRELEASNGVQDVEALTAFVAAAKDAGAESHSLADGEEMLRKLIVATVAEAAEREDEVALHEALKTAQERGVEEQVIQDGQLKLRTLASAREVAAAHELVAALEVAGAATEEDEDGLRAAVAEALEVGLGDSPQVQEAQVLLQRVAVAQDVGTAMKQTPQGWTAVVSEDNDAKRRRVEAKAAAEPGATTATADSADEEALGLAAAVDDLIDSAAVAAMHRAAMQRCALCRLEVALLLCQKRLAVEEEDFDLAQEAKSCEPGAASRLAAARQRLAGISGGGGSESSADDISAQLAELEARKRKALEEEDFDLCAEIHQRKQNLERQRSAGSPSGASAPQMAERKQELERVRALKHRAVEEEDFERAVALKQNEEELELQLAGAPAGVPWATQDTTGPAVEQTAAAILAQAVSHQAGEALLLQLDPGVAACARGAGSHLWEAMVAELRGAASSEKQH